MILAKKTKMAVWVQARARGHVARRAYAALLALREANATRLQAVYRCHRVRLVRWRFLELVRLLKAAAREKVALWAQKHARRKRDAKRFQEVKRARVAATEVVRRAWRRYKLCLLRHAFAAAIKVFVAETKDRVARFVQGLYVVAGTTTTTSVGRFACTDEHYNNNSAVLLKSQCR